MKKKFPGYYQPTKEEFKEIWEKCVFVFDTSYLLDFYRYPKELIDAMFIIFEKIKDRIWIPYKVACEYHKNIDLVIKEQIKSCNDIKTSIDKLVKSISEKRKHPFIKEELLNNTNKLKEDLLAEIELKQKELEGLFKENIIKEKISENLNSKIGDGFSNDDLEKIYIEGETRYENKIPPGYEDKNKPENKSKFGDLVIWKEILEKAKIDDLPILFITSEKKKDWFYEVEGFIRPNPQLINEFKKTKDKLFYIYKTDIFLKHANKYLDAKISEKSIEDIKDLIEEKEKDITQSETDEILKEKGGEINLDKEQTQAEKR